MPALQVAKLTFYYTSYILEGKVMENVSLPLLYAENSVPISTDHLFPQNSLSQPNIYISMALSFFVCKC